MGKQFYVQLNCVITLQLNSGNGIFTQNSVISVFEIIF